MTRRAWLAFAAMSVIWGVPYLLIRIGVRHGFTPGTLAFGRVALGAVVLLVLAWRAGTLGTLKGHWGALCAYAVAEVVIPFPAIAFGEERISSSLSAILISTMPLLVALLSLWINRSQRPTPIRLAGLLLGFGGVVALVGIDVAGKSSELVGAIAILIAAIGYTFGSTLVNLRLTRLDPRATMGASLGIAAVLLAPYAALDPPRATPSSGAFAAVIALGLLCTALAFVIFTVLIAEAGTSRASVITYINPLVAVILGVALLGEQLGPGAIVGLALILAGSWLATTGRLPPGVDRLVTPATSPRSGQPAPEGTARRGNDLRELDQEDRDQNERDREDDRPAVEVALDE